MTAPHVLSHSFGSFDFEALVGPGGWAWVGWLVIHGVSSFIEGLSLISSGTRSEWNACGITVHLINIFFVFMREVNELLFGLRR